MKKIILFLLVLVQTTLFAQNTQTIEKPLKLSSVSKGTANDSILLFSSSKLVKYLPVSELKTITNLDYLATPKGGTVFSSTGNDAVVPLATNTYAGLLDPADKVKINNLNGKEDKSNKNTANGYAGLGIDGKLISSQLPSIVLTDTYVTASQGEMLALLAETGDIAVRTDLNKSFILKGTNSTVLADWQELLTPTSAVTTVFGRNGAVTALVGDYTATMVGAPSGSGTSTGANTGDQDISGKENLSNKQNSLAVDGTGLKFPTVDAVNAGLATKGTVTSVSGINGVTFATGTTTPVIGLGEITPTSTNGVSAATMAFNNVTSAIQGQIDSKANLVSPTFTGAPNLPTGTIAVTQTAGNSTTFIATTAFATTANNLKADIASPTFTGTPTAPTAIAGTNTTQLATTAFVLANGFSIPHLEFNNTNKTVWNNGNGNVVSNTSFGEFSMANSTTGSTNTAIGYNSLRFNTSGSGNTANGYNSLYFNTTGANNTANGSSSLLSNTTGFANTASGWGSLYYNTTGFANTAIGLSSLYSNTSGYTNTAIGWSSSYSNTSGYNNTATGYESLFNNTTGRDNVANGVRSLRQNTLGNSNTAIGSNSLYNNTTANDNTAIGSYALNANTTGSSNAAIGTFALLSNTTGASNTANGFNSLRNNNTGRQNTAIGSDALYSNTTSDGNTANGYSSLYYNTTGKENVSIGSLAGALIASKTTPANVLDNSVLIGYRTSPLASNQTNQVVIGYDATGLGSNTSVIGNSLTLFSRIWGRNLVGTSIDNGVDDLQVNGTASFSPATLSNQGVVKSQLDLKANIASPTFTGTPTAPTAIAGTNTTQLATTAFVNAANTGNVTISGAQDVNGYKSFAGGLNSYSYSFNLDKSGKFKANGFSGAITLDTFNGSLGIQTSTVSGLAGETPFYYTAPLNIKNGGIELTGTPTAPTATLGTNTTQLATTAFVLANAGNSMPYKVYTALISQNGTGDPITTVLENTLGNVITWTRTSAGIYNGQSSNSFTTNKTTINISTGFNSTLIARYCGVVDSSNVSISTSFGSTPSDSQMSNNYTSISIKVYN